MQIIAKTLYGLEDIAIEELQSMGYQDLDKMNRAIAFEGELEDLYRVNLEARSILRFLVEVSRFKAHNDRHLYQQAQKINWSNYLSVDQTFSIDSTVYSQRFRHSRYAALKVKDAIVDQFREKDGKRPNVNTDKPDVRINLHISETDVTISLDSSGESLEKRGYRQEANEAPMSECLAAAMLIASKWDKKTPLLDPMTGSGTIIIEAALLATNTPPGLHREYGFERWMNYNEALKEKIELELRSKIEENNVELRGWDVNATSISIAKRNAMRAGVIDMVKFEQQDFLKSKPIAEKAFVIFNPPYGERLEEDERMPELYHNVGFHLKHTYPNHELWVISGNLQAIKRLGLKPHTKLKVFNGPIECRLNGYSLFQGKLKEQD